MPTQIPSSICSAAPLARPPFPPAVIKADFLFQGKQEIVISHNGAHYRLRITRNGKLILTK